MLRNPCKCLIHLILVLDLAALCAAVPQFHHKIAHRAKGANTGKTAFGHGNHLINSSDIGPYRIIHAADIETVQIERSSPHAKRPDLLTGFLVSLHRILRQRMISK